MEEQRIIIHGSRLEAEKTFDPLSPEDRSVTVEVRGIMRSPSDGFHTFDELYDHRITLYIALCRIAKHFAYTGNFGMVWRSKRHSDGEICFGTGTQFVLGIGREKGKQITYHIPIERWNETDFAPTLEIAPDYDEHSSNDVLERIKTLLK